MQSRDAAGLGRRSILQAVALVAGLFAAKRGLGGLALADPVPGAAGDVSDPLTLQPGQFLWRPDRAAEGPVAIFVSIPKQLVFIYRDGILIGISTCSTGKPGHSTPAGLFTILHKLKDHRSSKYGDPMPNTLRLTRKGVALHGGDVPGYPMSHGCVHLPLDFADDLFELTALGTPVIIGGHDDHILVSGPGIAPAGSAGKLVAARNAARSLAPAGPDADTAILISAADRRIYALQDGTLIAQGPATIKNAAEPLGTNVFVWRGGEPTGTASIWNANFEPVPGGAVVSDAFLLERLDANRKMLAMLERLMHSGTVLLTTDEPLNPRRQREVGRRKAGNKQAYRPRGGRRRRQAS